MDENKKVTLKDIAIETGLSVVTVSKVLNSGNTTAASKEKINLINQAALRLGYSTRSSSSSVKVEPIKICVFIATNNQLNYNHPFYRGLYNAIKEHASKNNIQIQFYHELEEVNSNSTLKSMIYNSDIKSIIILGEMYSWDSTEIKMLKSRFEHVVSISPYYYSNKLNLTNDVIIIDTYFTSKSVLSKLVENGRKKILLLCGPTTSDIATTNFELWRLTADGREIAYYEVMKENDLPITEDLIYNCNWDPDVANDILEELITNKKVEFDAIFAGDDMIALACMKVLNKHKIDIPGQVAVVGFNNQEFSRYASPSLSSIDIYYDTIGAMAVELIKYKSISGDKVPLKVIIPSNYVKRKSCGL